MKFLELFLEKEIGLLILNKDFKSPFNSMTCWNANKNIFNAFFFFVKVFYSHCAKLQKYEQSNIGLQFFDMWYL